VFGQPPFRARPRRRVEQATPNQRNVVGVRDTRSMKDNAPPKRCCLHTTEHAKPSAAAIAAMRAGHLRFPCPTSKAEGLFPQPTGVVMNETPELEVVELGEAKDLTKGPPSPLASEESGPHPQKIPS
jgi:hypothetical protein